jgi:hypothetical protein
MTKKPFYLPTLTTVSRFMRHFRFLHASRPANALCVPVRGLGTAGGLGAMGDLLQTGGLRRDGGNGEAPRCSWNLIDGRDDLLGVGKESVTARTTDFSLRSK